MGLQVFDESIPDTNAIVFDDSSSPGALPLTPNDKALRRVDAIVMSNNDAIDHVVRVRVNIAANYYWLGSATIPAGAGFAGAPGIDLMAAALPVTQIGINLYSFSFLELYVEEAITPTFGVWASAIGGLF